MPKKAKNESVLQDWVNTLTFQQQALLITGMRGPDGCDKHNPAKCIVRYLRGAVLKPAGNWSGRNDNDFMWGDKDLFDGNMGEFFYDADRYPHHFLMHLIHCMQVVGYKHPDVFVAKNFGRFYLKACKALHMHAETEIEMDMRLNDFGEGI